MTEHRITDSAQHVDDNINISLRPRSFHDFIGQSQLKENLGVFIQAAKLRNEALDHVLFYGPPGLGKTTLSQIIANEIGVDIKITSGPMISKTGDLAAILTNLQDREVLFIDEIHRLPAAVEELLYPAMEDYAIDLIIGEGPTARSVKINLPQFTLIGATTRMGLLSNPLRDRFGIPLKLDFYSIEELQRVIMRGSLLMKIEIETEAAEKLAKCARGTPRIAMRMLRRIRDFAHHKQREIIDLELIFSSLFALGIDNLGLDQLDYRYMLYIHKNYGIGAVGIETIAAGLAEDRDTIEDVVEPYLMQIGFLARTSRGRMLTESGISYAKAVCAH